MTCPTCEPWAARTMERWKLRQMGQTPFACPACRTKDWAKTTSFCIDEPDVVAPQSSWWLAAWLVFTAVLVGAMAYYIITGDVQ